MTKETDRCFFTTPSRSRGSSRFRVTRIRNCFSHTSIIRQHRPSTIAETPTFPSLRARGRLRSNDASRTRTGKVTRARKARVAALPCEERKANEATRGVEPSDVIARAIRIAREPRRLSAASNIVHRHASLDVNLVAGSRTRRDDVRLPDRRFHGPCRPRHRSPRPAGLQRGAIFESAAESILAQTYENFDLLIADNASTDRTQTICRELSHRDSRVRYVRHAESIGMVPNRNSRRRRRLASFCVGPQMMT